MILTGNAMFAVESHGKKELILYCYSLSELCVYLVVRSIIVVKWNFSR